MEQILEKFNMTNCNPVPTPVSKSQVQNLPSMEALLEEKGPEVFPGRTAIGMIGWLVQLTRPDLCQAFNYVCRLHLQVILLLCLESAILLPLNYIRATGAHRPRQNGEPRQPRHLDTSTASTQTSTPRHHTHMDMDMESAGCGVVFT